MPIPTPGPNEGRDSFIPRCVAQLATTDPNMDSKQRVAVCFQQYQRHSRARTMTNKSRTIGESIMKVARKVVRTLNTSTATFQFTTDLSEATPNTTDPLILENVAILGPVSLDAGGKIRRRYTDECLQRAVGIFEGAPAFIDHQSKDKQSQHRSIRDMYGYYRGVRADLQEHKLRGSLHLFDNELGKHVAAIAKSNPALAGNSIQAAGRIRKEGDVQVVEEILPRNMWGVRASVDLVSDPATTRTLFESTDNNLNEESSMTVEYGNLTLAVLREQRDDLYSALLQEGAASRNKEIDDLKTQLNEARQKQQDAEKERDALKSRVGLAEQKSVIDKLIGESGIPGEHISDVFRNMLYSLQEHKEGDKVITIAEQAKAQLEDRRKALGFAGVKAAGDPYVPLAENRKNKRNAGTKDDDDQVNVVLGSIGTYRK